MSGTRPASHLHGFVLCGGSSTRMGRDKASILVDGEPMALRVAGALEAAGASTVTAVGGDAALLRSWGLSHAPDRWPGAGPLGALVTALALAGPDAEAIVLACDLLAPSSAAVAHVASVRRAADADAAVPVAQGRRQWMHAAWHGRAMPTLESMFLSGERSVVRATLGLRLVPVDGLASAVLADADSPADLPAGLRSTVVDIPAIDIPTLRERMEAGAPVFDVRQPDEYAQARVPGVQLVPLDQVPEQVERFPTDETVYVICRSGARSAKAVEFLRARGVDAVNVSGGTLAWIDAGHAVDSGD